MATLWRRLVAEAFGTFGLVFVGSAVVDDRNSIYIIEVLGTVVAAGASIFF